MPGTFRRQILRQRLPLAAGREHIEDRVQNLADVHLAPTPTAFGRRDRRFDQRPLAVAQITRVAQAMAVGSAAVFRLPHSAPLSSVSGAREGITTDSSDSATLWIGSHGRRIDKPILPSSGAKLKKCRFRPNGHPLCFPDGIFIVVGDNSFSFAGNWLEATPWVAVEKGHHVMRHRRPPP